MTESKPDRLAREAAENRLAGAETRPRLAMPASAREPARTCGFVAVPVPLSDSSGRITGVQLNRPACNADCALYDRTKDRPCLTALREDIVEALGVAMLAAMRGPGPAQMPSCVVCGAPAKGFILDRGNLCEAHFNAERVAPSRA